MSVEIKSSDKEVLCSGSFIVFDVEKSSIISIENGDEKLDLELSFLNDETKGVEIGFEVKSETLLSAKFYNFNNALGNGTITPINMGTMGKRKIFFHIWIYALGIKKTLKRVEYTFYLGEKNG